MTELQNALACAARVFELLDAEDQTPDAENAAKLVPDGRGPDSRTSPSRYLPEPPAHRGPVIWTSSPASASPSSAPPAAARPPSSTCSCGSMTSTAAPSKWTAPTSADVTRAALRGSYGMVLQETWLARRHRPGEHRLRQAGRHPRRGGGRGQGRPCRQLHPAPARGLRHRHRRGRRQHLSQGQKQLLCIARVMLLPAAHADPGRGHLLHRHPHRGAHPGRPLPG